MSPIEKNCPTWACHHCFSESIPSISQHIFHKGGHPRVRGWGTAPNSSIKVTDISKQYFILGWLDGSLQAGDQDGKWEGELSSTSGSHRSFALWDGTSAWPSIWRLAPDISSSRSLNLAAMHMKLVVVKLKLWIQPFNVGAKALAKNKTNHLIWVNCVLVTLFGTLFIHHQWGSLSDVGMPPIWEKGSHLPQGTTKLGKLRDGHNSATAPTAEPDLGSSSLLGGVLKCGAHPGMPEMWQVCRGAQVH